MSILSKIEAAFSHAKATAESLEKDAVAFIQNNKAVISPILADAEAKIKAAEPTLDPAIKAIAATALEALKVPVNIAVYLSDEGVTTVQAELIKLLQEGQVPPAAPIV